MATWQALLPNDRFFGQITQKWRIFKMNGRRKFMADNPLGGTLFQLAECQPNWPIFYRHLTEDLSKT